MSPLPPTPPLPALVKAPELRGWVRMAVELGPVSRIVGPVAFARGWDELRVLSRRSPGAPAVVERGAALNKRWAELGAPIVPVSRTARARDAKALESAVLRSIDPAGALGALEEMERRAGREARRIAARILSMAHRPCAVPEVAAGLGYSQATLARRCAVSGLPCAKRLISLARVFTVERLAEWSRQPSGVVAVALGFSNPSNYRRLVRGTFGAPPSVVRERGGARYVARVVSGTHSAVGSARSQDARDEK